MPHLSAHDRREHRGPAARAGAPRVGESAYVARRRGSVKLMNTGRDAALSALPSRYAVVLVRGAAVMGKHDARRQFRDPQRGGRFVT